MTKTTRHKVFYAGGETGSERPIPVAVSRAGLNVTCFVRISDCLQSLESSPCDLLISNAGRPAIEGMELLVAARRVILGLPVIMLVDRGDVATAVDAIKAGACDCLERPPKPAQLRAAVDHALRVSPPRRTSAQTTLSPVEKRVLQLVLKGHTSAAIAGIMRRSPRTIEAHRRHLMHKIGARNVVELAHRLGRIHPSAEP